MPNLKIPPQTPFTLSLVAGLWAFASNALAYSEQGRLHDTATWRSDEFTSNWGLAAIGADAAYARGLSGDGVRLSLADSGTDLRHSEFGEKDHRPIRLADEGCQRETMPGATQPGCFYSEGDRASIEYNDLPPKTLAMLQDMVANGTLSNLEFDRYKGMLGASYDPHGTHVAGTMLANRDGNGMHGVAYGANLSPIRLFSHIYNDAPYSLDRTVTVNASNEAYANAYQQMQEQNVRVINHSWGIPEKLDTVEQLDAALNVQRSSVGTVLGNMSLGGGLLQVWAAGNSQRRNQTPETAPFADALASLPRAMPELEPYWLTVVNLNQNLTLDPSSFRCGYSKEWCVAAPGTRITSTVVDSQIKVENIYDKNDEVEGFKVIDERLDFDYDTYTGTSMAAPHVTGALGLLIERFPYLDNPQIRDVLLTTAQDLGEPGVDDVYGWGLIDLKKAIDGPGQIRVDTTVVMDRRAGGAVVWQGHAWDDWRNNISGPGRLSKAGEGWLRLSGDNSFAGATLYSGLLELDGNNRLTSDVTIQGGLLRLNGTLQDTDLNVKGGIAQINGRQQQGLTRVSVAGVLSGDGQLSDTHVQGTIVPGSEQRPLTINGEYRQLEGSTLILSPALNPAAISLQVRGLAHIEGGTLRLTHLPDAFALGKHYGVLQADAGINGQFTSIDHRQFSPFLSFTQTREAHTLGFDVGRGLPLVAAATNANQRATAHAADGLDISHTLAQRLTSLFPNEATRALDQLSGDLHPGIQSVMIEDSRVIREAALQRARSAGDNTSRPSGSAGQAVWVQSIHSNGRLDGDGNAARISHSRKGVMIGADHDFEHGTRAGVVLASTEGSVTSANAGKATIDTYQIGVHAGHTWGAFGLYGGVAYARNPIQTKRRVSFSDIDDSLSTRYVNHTRQLFTEGNYRWELGPWDVQPYLQFAHVSTRSAGFSETAGISALKGKPASQAVNLNTGGVRLSLDMGKTSMGPSWLSLNGGVAYTRASGDLSPTVDASWQGASSMRIAGAPLNRSVVNMNAGAVARLTRDSALSLSITNQRGNRSREQSVNAQYQFEF